MNSLAEQVIEQLNFVQIPGGEFVMGTLWDEDHFNYLMHNYTVFVDWFIKEVPQHLLHLPTYDISEIPVTFAMLTSFLHETEYNVDHLPAILRQNLMKEPGDFPAYPVTAPLAEAFCAWLNEHNSEYRFSLPTEPEWEKAARGTDGREFPWGNEQQPPFINIRGVGEGKVIAVRHTAKHESPYGLYDLAGNVEEMTSSFNAVYEGMPIQVPDYLRYRILRGGTAEHDLDLTRCARRHGKHPSTFTGFRVVRKQAVPLLALEPQPFLLQQHDWVFASINKVTEHDVYMDLDRYGEGIVPIHQFSEHDLKVFKRLHSRSEIIVQVVSMNDEQIICRRPDMTEICNMMCTLGFEHIQMGGFNDDNKQILG
ncbi:formylglycine-generating enzyme family protein [Paenibacillus campi]|uniref:formylglycine-generating enzyme family protein n=1 Tax=Paenibacillus campi TaxID=3106031 RepID=UPI002AFE67EA|nr:SUMF1/EgtB/PvdO family nonheme iron enzyme [Paenibacillus sp. SGZ-1014]